MRLLLAVFCVAVTLDASRAQEVQIDLDRLSKIAYCAAVFKEQEATLPLPAICRDHPKQEAKFCASVSASLNELEEKRARFALYVTSRLISSDAALFAVSGAMATATAEADGCFQAIFHGLNSSTLADCQKIKICSSATLPY